VSRVSDLAIIELRDYAKRHLAPTEDDKIDDASQLVVFVVRKLSEGKQLRAAIDELDRVERAGHATADGVVARMSAWKTVQRLLGRPL
jgi:hypothetical protein